MGAETAARGRASESERGREREKQPRPGTRAHTHAHTHKHTHTHTSPCATQQQPASSQQQQQPPSSPARGPSIKPGDSRGRFPPPLAFRETPHQFCWGFWVSFPPKSQCHCGARCLPPPQTLFLSPYSLGSPGARSPASMGWERVLGAAISEGRIKSGISVPFRGSFRDLLPPSLAIPR